MIPFKDIKSGSIVYVLITDKSHIKATQGKVTHKADPRLNSSLTQNLTNFSASALSQMQERVIDATIEIEGVSKTYCIPENLSVTYADGLIISTEREGIIREVQAQKNLSEEHIKQTPFEEEKKKQCDEILENWDPVFKEKRETEQRFSEMERRMSKFEEGQNRMNENFEKFLKKFE